MKFFHTILFGIFIVIIPIWLPFFILGIISKRCISRFITEEFDEYFYDD